MDIATFICSLRAAFPSCWSMFCQPLPRTASQALKKKKKAGQGKVPILERGKPCVWYLLTNLVGSEAPKLGGRSLPIVYLTYSVAGIFHTADARISANELIKP